ncbi:hypothetical protein [Nocardia sp. NPDC020380]|uniref:hypothetical protein n=1 Tax=Nocardia sp. NPDC020380 TaxID=3364309 RepID=UPI00379AA607
MTTVINRPQSDHKALPNVRNLLPSRADTPGWIRYLAIAVVVVALITALVMAADARSARNGVGVIGHHTAPTVTATEDLYFALADMDAQLANVLLAGDDPALAKVRTSALTTYDQRRTQVDADLQQAMTIATNGDAATQIRNLLDKFGQYQSQAADTLQLANLDPSPAGQPSARTLTAYRSATGMVPDLLKSAQTLADTNSGVLSQAYNDSEHTTAMARLRIVVLGLVLLAALIGLQVLLRVALRRRVNPALAVGTLLAAGLLIGGFAANSSAAQQFTVAKKDAFDSLLALRQARAVSYDANADESRYLLDPQNAAVYEKSFYDKSQQLAGVSATGIGNYASALDQAIAANPGSKANALTKDSFLGQELRNITFPGEGEAAANSLLGYQKYIHDDAQIRILDHNGDLTGAIALDTGGSNTDFGGYDTALQNTIEINQQAFDKAISNSEDALSGWNALLPYGGMVVLAVLVLVGVRPRLAEYR